MDFGHNGQDPIRHASASEQPFFTAGQGNDMPERNDFEPENNLDLSNKESTWGITNYQSAIQATDSFNTQEVIHGSQEAIAISQETTPQNNPESTSGIMSKTPSNLPDFILDAPGPIDTFESNNISFSERSIRTEGDHLSKTAIKEVEAVISALDSTGNVADFYSAIRGDAKHPGMMQANLKNSFNREVGE